MPVPGDVRGPVVLSQYSGRPLHGLPEKYLVRSAMADRVQSKQRGYFAHGLSRRVMSGDRLEAGLVIR